MKKLLFISLGIVLAVCLLLYIKKNTLLPIPKTVVPVVTDIKKNNNHIKSDTASVFVPYWTMQSPLAVDRYDEVIYFGITATTSGIDRTDDGYTKLPEFVAALPSKKRALVALRMIDSQIAFTIIENEEKRKKLIVDTIHIAKQYHFQGIVLDLEVKSLPFDSVLQNISTFQKEFYTSAKNAGVSFDFAIYGDTFYRIRPFNVKDVGQYADTVMIMAYDFSKAGGADPGPNFPYSGKERYGYDFQQMVDDFLTEIPAEKIAIVFGMYGYDWIVTTKGKAESNGVATSLYKIRQNFLSTCIYVACQVKRDALSSETTITYIDVLGKKHIVWFEDQDSVGKKKSYLKEKNITKLSYWAYSYF